MIHYYAYTSEGRNHANQDIFGFKDSACWVLDGATPLFGDAHLGGNDVQKTMQKISAFLSENYTSDLTPADNLYQACLSVSNEYRRNIKDFDDIPAYKLPTFAFALVTCHEEVMQYCVLGDCEIRTSSGTHIKDHRFDHINVMNQNNDINIKKQMHITDINILDKETYQKYYAHKLKADQTQRSYLNTDTDNGYWIGSLDGKGFSHAYQGKVKLIKGETVYLYCDGFAHLLEKHPVLLEQLSDDAVNQVCDETSDDVTIISFQV